jgi:hypothetical protein
MLNSRYQTADSTPCDNHVPHRDGAVKAWLSGASPQLSLVRLRLLIALLWVVIDVIGLVIALPWVGICVILHWRLSLVTKKVGKGSLRWGRWQKSPLGKVRTGYGLALSSSNIRAADCPENVMN